MSVALLVIGLGCISPVSGKDTSHLEPDSDSQLGHDMQEAGDSDSTADDSSDTAGDSSDHDSMDSGGEDSETSDTGGTDTASVLDAPLAGADAKLLGEEAGDAAGMIVASGGDADGDGRADLLIGAPEHGTGAVYLVLGPVSGDRSLSDATARLTFEGIDDPSWGIEDTPVAGVGDLDGDGLGDLAVGGSGVESGAGGAYVVYGLVSGDFSLADADATLTGLGSSDAVGTSVAGPGDVDGDGLDDLLVGTPSGNGRDRESDVGACADDDVEEYGDEGGDNAGYVYLMRGPQSAETTLRDAEARLLGEDGNDAAGFAVARAGDLDGDGLDDLYLGANLNCEGGIAAGAAYVVSGPVSGDLYLEDADAKLVGEGGSSIAGRAVAGAGDVDGDGTADLLVGATGYMEYGAVYLVLGPVSGHVDLGDASADIKGAFRDAVGQAIASAGDLDRDGYGDLLIGAPTDSTIGLAAGAAFIVMGPVSGSYDLSETDAKFTGGEERDQAAWSVTGPGDVDADGLPDLLIGVLGDDDAGDGAGAAYLLLGSGSLLSGLRGG